MEQFIPAERKPETTTTPTGDMQTSSENTNLIKIRDDRDPIEFSLDADDKLCFAKSIKPNWLPDGPDLNDLGTGVEPWLSALFQSEHLSLLVGSGLSTAIHCLAVGQYKNQMGKPSLSDHCPYKADIDNHANSSAKMLGRGDKANVEDYFRVICDLLNGLRYMDSPEQQREYEELRKEYDGCLKTFVDGILTNENEIAAAHPASRAEAMNALISFLMSFASRTGTRDRLNIFTTNYDRIIELGAELAGLHLLDRFTGSMFPIFRASRLDVDMHYNPPGIRGEPRYLEGVARYAKIHGSIDWVSCEKDIRRLSLPFGAQNVETFLGASGFQGISATDVMIFPNSSKDRETAQYPYVELFRDLAAALCRPNSTIVTYGYSFGDEHINRILRDMLTIPSTHLVVISYDQTPRINDFYLEYSGRISQISLLLGNDLGDISKLTKYFLPKPAIDRSTIRMNEMIKQRFPKCDKDQDDSSVRAQEVNES